MSRKRKRNTKSRTRKRMESDAARSHETKPGWRCEKCGVRMPLEAWQCVYCRTKIAIGNKNVLRH